MSSRIPTLCTGLLALALCGCSVLPKQSAVVLYDFGPSAVEPAPADVPGSVRVAAPGWLDGPGMAYRLAYADPARVAVYRDSRWTAPVAALMQEHLQQRVARASRPSSGRLLRVELEEFSHWFSSPHASRAVVRLRAELLDEGTDRVLARQAFAQELDARSADAAGGAHALAEAARRAAAAVLAWASQVP